MGADCRYAKSLALEYIRGELDASAEDEVRTHISICPSCRAELDATISLLDAVRAGTGMKASSRFAERVLSRAAEIGEAPASDRLAALVAKPYRNIGEKATLLVAFLGHRFRKAPVWAAAVAVHAAAILVLACVYIPFKARDYMGTVPTSFVPGSAEPLAEDLPNYFGEGRGGEPDIDSGPMKIDGTHRIEPDPWTETGPEQVESGRTSGEPTPPWIPKRINSGISMVGAWFGFRSDEERKAKALEKFQGSETAPRVAAALKFLASRQESDGGFSADDPQAGSSYRIGITGLALLAFLGDGNSRSKGTYKSVVSSGMSFLMDNQDDETGLFGSSQGHYMYNQGIAASAVLECYGLEKAAGRAGPADLKESAARAVSFIASSVNETGGFGYTHLEKTGDTSVTAWQLNALALFLSLCPSEDQTAVRSAIKGVRRWIKSVTDGQGYVGYRAKGGVKTFPESMTAVGLYMNSVLLGNRGYVAKRQAELVSRKPPSSGAPADFYFWYYASCGLLKTDAAKFGEWNRLLKKAVATLQAEDGGFSRASAYGDVGGRVFTTAMAALTMEVYYRIG